MTYQGPLTEITKFLEFTLMMGIWLVQSSFYSVTNVIEESLFISTFVFVSYCFYKVNSHL